MYSGNQISKEDILENILEVEQENNGPEHLRIIANKLKKKLEEKAEKLRSLRLSQQLGSSLTFKEENIEISHSDSRLREEEDRLETGEYDSYIEEEEEEVEGSMSRDLEDKYFNHSLSDIYTSQASYQH